MIYLNLLIIILLIIFIHELGHYSVARLFKTRVTDFSIGFGKVLYQKKDKNNTNWKLSIIPLGGYVKIKGLESIFQNNNPTDFDRDSFQCLKFYQNKRSIKTASDTQARKKLYKSSVKSWKNYEKYVNKSFSKLLN